jgi:hypothetical protein
MHTADIMSVALFVCFKSSTVGWILIELYVNVKPFVTP